MQADSNRMAIRLDWSRLLGFDQAADGDGVSSIDAPGASGATCPNLRGCLGAKIGPKEARGFAGSRAKIGAWRGKDENH